MARHDRDDLVDLIAEDLRADLAGTESTVKYDTPEDAPQIYIDESRGTRNLHVSIISRFWEDVPEVQRPGIILDAFAKAGRRDERDRIAVAMGLTPDEAAALGLETD